MMGKSVGRLAFAAFSLAASGLSVRADADVLEGYTPLEYIESTGVQWVNTGVPGNTVYGLKAGIIVTGVQNQYQSLIAGKCDDFTIGMAGNIDNYYLRYRGDQKFSGAVDLSSSVRHDLVLQDGNFQVDGVVKASGLSGALDKTTYNISICNVGDGTGSRLSKLKVYYLQLYTSRGALMANLFPVKSTSGDQIGLYDLERKQFCGNAGGGVFTAGPASTSWRLAADGSLEVLATIAAPSDFGYTVNGTACTGPAEVWLKAGEPATLVADGNRNFRWTKKPAGAEMSGASSTWTPTAPENMAFEAVPTYYVRTGGNDQNNGLTPQTAFATLKTGLEKMSADNALDLGEGTFTCDAQLTVKSGSTIQGAGPGKTTLVFGNGDYRLNLSNASAEIPTALRNLTFTSGASHQGVVVWGAAYLEIENCIFEDIVAGGSDKGVVYLYGGWSSMSHVIIRNCRAGTKTGGVYINASSGLIENCLFYDNSLTTDNVDYGANGYWDGGAVTLNNCTFGRSSMTQAKSFREANNANCKLNNCLFYSKNSTQSAVSEHCLVWGAGDYATKWVNYESGNYRLTAAATDAIDQGQAITTVKDDLAGVKRPQGAAYDIGCYEFPRAKKGIVFIFHGR